jgi:hypothetical protein
MSRPRFGVNPGEAAFLLSRIKGQRERTLVPVAPLGPVVVAVTVPVPRPVTLRVAVPPFRPVSVVCELPPPYVVERVAL